MLVLYTGVVCEVWGLGERLWYTVRKERWEVESSEPKEFIRSFSGKDGFVLKGKVI